MSTEHPQHHTDLNALIEADRELTRDEQDKLKNYAGAGWSWIIDMVEERARAAYAVIEPAEFAVCITEHMNPAQRSTLIEAEMFSCPKCGRLLKDRRSPVASAIMLERNRIRGLWLTHERASEGDKSHTLAQFKAGLGL